MSRKLNFPSDELFSNETMKSSISSLFILVLLHTACAQQHRPNAMEKGDTSQFKVVKTDSEWRQTLTLAQYNITRMKGTERAFTGRYDDFYEKGTYECVCCGEVLFKSETKFNAGCGWPSFYESDSHANIRLTRDTSFGMVRTEVTCGSCGAHLGHVFDDGPPPTYKRYCINSESLRFIPDNASTQKK